MNGKMDLRNIYIHLEQSGEYFDVLLYAFEKLGNRYNE